MLLASFLVQFSYAAWTIGADWTISADWTYTEGEEEESEYTLELVISDPDNTTYTTPNVPVVLSTTGNDTNPAYNWNFYYSNGTAFYVSNQTAASQVITFTENATGTFACIVTGDHLSDYGEVGLTVNYTTATTYYLTVQSPTTGGSCSPSAGSYEYAADTNVTLTATHSLSYAFSGWEVDGANETTSSSTWYVVMNGNRTVKAYFTAEPRLDTISVTGLWQNLLNGDFLGFLQAVFLFAFSSSDIFYGVVAMVVCVPIYIRTRSLVFLCVIWILLGGFLIALMPMVSGVAILFMALGIGGLVFKLIRSRTT